MLVETVQLTKDYGDFRALDQLDLKIAAGEVFGLLGPNGSGKSTTLRILMGFLRPTLGQARIDGHDCWQDSVAVRRKTAYLPGELRLYENMTGRRLLHFLAGLRGEALDDKAGRLAQRLDIDLDRPIANLSSGMKRKLALMQVLLPTVPLLILDEPTNTLDPTMRDELLAQLLAAKQRGQAVLFSSHVLQEVERVCDRVAILSKGRLVHLQQMSELRASRLARVRFPEDHSNAAEREPPFPAGAILLTRQGNELRFQCDGELQPLLQWLSTRQVSDLQIEPLGLSAIYQRFHAGAP